MVSFLESGVELELEKTEPRTAGYCCCCSWSCAAFDGVFGSRLPRCSCLATAQQSYSKRYTNRTEPRNARGRRCSAACHLTDSRPALARVYVLFGPLTQNPTLFFRKRLAIYYQTSRRGLQALVLGTPMFLTSPKNGPNILVYCGVPGTLLGRAPRVRIPRL